MCGERGLAELFPVIFTIRSHYGLIYFFKIWYLLNTIINKYSPLQMKSEEVLGGDTFIDSMRQTII